MPSAIRALRTGFSSSGPEGPQHHDDENQDREREEIARVAAPAGGKRDEVRTFRTDVEQRPRQCHREEHEGEDHAHNALRPGRRRTRVDVSHPPSFSHFKESAGKTDIGAVCDSEDSACHGS